MSHVGSLNCSKEEGLQKLNLASKALKFSAANLLPPGVVAVVAENRRGIYYLFPIFSFEVKIDSTKKRSLIR